MSNVTVIIPGAIRYPDAGEKATASPKRGVNLIDTVLGPNMPAKAIEITAYGPVEVFVNGEILSPYSEGEGVHKYFHRGEGQGPGGTRYGTIRTLEVVGSGQFVLTVN